MRSSWKAVSLAALLLGLGLGIFHASPAQGQASSPNAAQDDDSDDGPAQPFLALIVTLDGGGKAEGQLSYFLGEQASLTTAEARDILQSALGCTIQSSSRYRGVSGYYGGSCAMPASVRGLLREGRISTARLEEFSRAHNVAFVSVQLRLPDSDVLETRPALRRNTASSSAATAAVNRYMRSLFVYVGSPDKPLPAEIAFRYGYSLPTVRRNAGLLVVMLLFPLVLLVWLGRKALAADVNDKAVVWFSYMRSLRWILNGSLIGWWVALDYCHAEPMLRFITTGTRFAALGAHPVAYEALSWVPPAILWLLCYRISHPVQQRLRGLHWTKRELTLQALYSVLAGLFPFAMFLTGLRVIATGGFRAAMFWWLGAFLLRVFAAQALLKATGMQPQALSSGDLRDRAFAMAGQLGVKLRQVYLIPSGKGQLANAFARTGNTISFTDFLLQRMSQREVDYVMAHELTHLKLKHPAKLGYAYLSGILLAVFAMTLSARLLHDSALVRYALIFAIISVFPYFWSRRFEYSADAGAVSATGDPRAAISALFKLSELNLMPLHWSKWREKWLTHPSSLRRARAVAKKAGIAYEEIPAIAREGAADTASYAVPANAAPGARVHSTQRTRGITLKLSLALVGVFAFVPALFCLAAIHCAGPAKWALFAAALPATLVFFLVFANYSPWLTHKSMAAALEKKLAGDGVQAAAWSGIFVGLSPAAAPRIYEGSANWDIGYLFLRSDRLCYWGEETKFALRQEQITAMALDEGMPSLLSTKRIYLAWKDDERGASGIFNIGCGKAASTSQANQRTAELARRLQAWWKTPPIARPVPPQLAGLRPPETRAVTSHDPAERRKPKKMFNELCWTGIFTGVAGTLCGLPFHLLPYVLAAAYGSSYTRPGIRNFVSTPGAGWFAIAAAIAVRLLTLWPLLRYRGTAKVSVESSTKHEAAEEIREAEKVEPEKVPVG